MAKLKINPSYSFEPGGYASISFAPCLEPENGEVSYVQTIYGCRDALGKEVRKHIMNDTIPTDKTRMMFMWNAGSSNNTGNVKEWATRGLNVLHVCEKLAGWPLTKAQEVEMPHANRYTLYCVSSRRWMKSSYLYTLYCLLMRICADSRISGFKNFDGLSEVMNKHRDATWDRDASHINKTFPYWKALLVGYPDLFRQYKITHYWGLDKIGVSDYNQAYGEGIYKLCDNSTKWTGMWKQLDDIRLAIGS